MVLTFSNLPGFADTDRGTSNTQSTVLKKQKSGKQKAAKSNMEIGKTESRNPINTLKR